jgi:hypothetical protein
MTDYQPLIARAVEGLGKSTGEARRGLYERARSALVTQLRAVDPPLSESDITRERLALEEAIRKVEADAARKARLEARTESRFEPRPLRPTVRTAAPPPSASPSPPPPPAPPPPPPAPPPQERIVAKPPVEEPVASWNETSEAEPETFVEAQTEPVPPTPPAPPPRTSPPTARSRLLGARTSSLSQEGIKGFRNVVSDADDLGSATAKAAKSARETRDTYEPLPRQINDDLAPPSPRDNFVPKLDGDELRDYDTLQQDSLEPSFHLEDDEPPLFPGQSGRAHPPRPPEEDDEYEHTRPPRSYVGLIKIAVIGCIVGILAAVFAWQWPNISHLVARIGSHTPTQTAQQPQQQQQPKFSGRVPQDQNQNQSPGTNAPATSDQSGPTVAQRVVLYEEDPNDPQGRRFVGSAIWRTETVSPGPGLSPELAVRADIEIPDRRMTVTWSLRRNTDKALPASHTIEIMFNLPADFPGGGIANVPGVLMKQAEQARGTPLAGLAVKVTNGFFLIGLSAVDADKQRNMQLLKDQEWFDIPIVYTNGGRAILAVEKGPPGDRAFNDAFNAWSK